MRCELRRKGASVMNQTEINWTSLTWNPASGCTKISAGCKYCYAETLAENKRGTLAFPVGFDVTEKPWKLDEPRRVKPPSLIFTNSMTDMFHAEISDAYRDKILDVMNAQHRHRYQVLTKRPDLAAKYFRTRCVPHSMWLGATVEHEKTTWRLDAIRSIDARVRFVSAEPLVGDLGAIDLSGIHWLITGGESGTHLARADIAEERAIVRRVGSTSKWEPRPDRYHWITSVRDQCNAGGVAYWHKQWGGTRPHSAGRVVDGRTWDELPWHVPGALPDGYVHRAEMARSDDHVSLPVVA